MSISYALLFPGQGSQSCGMLKDLAQDYPLVKHLFEQASHVLGYDLWDLVQTNPLDKLNQTEYTQPALLAAEVAIWRCWQENNNAPQPSLMAGHSLGEYSALVCAEALDFLAAIKLVALRGQYMQQAVPPQLGAMAAIVGLDEQSAMYLCREVVVGEEILSPANYNSIGQVVIAGHATAVDRAIVAAKDKGAKLAKRIEVSVPSHCALMASAAKRLAADIAQVKLVQPKVPVLHNFDVAIHSDIEGIRHALIAQLTHPVRWVEIIQEIYRHHITVMVECGPGKVLSGLNKRIHPELMTYNLNESGNLRQTLDIVRGMVSIQQI